MDQEHLEFPPARLPQTRPAASGEDAIQHAARALPTRRVALGIGLALAVEGVRFLLERRKRRRAGVPYAYIRMESLKIEARWGTSDDS